MTPRPTSALFSIWVRVSKTGFDLEEEVVAFSHLAVALWMAERVEVMPGIVRMKPAPAEAAPEKKEMPRRRRGKKPAEKVIERLGVEAWKGRACTVVESLEVGGWRVSWKLSR